MTLPPAICICTPEDEAGRQRALEHFREIDLDVRFFWGIDAKTAGLSTSFTYEVDAPGSGYRMAAKSVGCWLSHYMLWSAIMYGQNEYTLILESDCLFAKGWREELTKALEVIPKNFDVLNLGPCCLEGHPKQTVSGNLYSTKHAFCTHAYILRRDCIPFLLKTMRKCWAPIDVQLVLEAYPHLNTFAITPRLVEQVNTILAP